MDIPKEMFSGEHKWLGQVADPNCEDVVVAAIEIIPHSPGYFHYFFVLSDGMFWSKRGVSADGLRLVLNDFGKKTDCDDIEWCFTKHNGEDPWWYVPNSWRFPDDTLEVIQDLRIGMQELL